MIDKCLRPGIPLAVILLLCSCSEQGPARKATFPVTGELYVDGQPAASVQVTLHDVKGIDTQSPTVSSTFTDENGKFAVSTYEEGDGVPAGDYNVTFMWGELNAFTMQYGGPDKLKKKYSDPKQSQFPVTVAEGTPTDMGRIDLTTQ